MMWRDGEVLSLRRRWGAPGRGCAEVEVRLTRAPSGATSLLPGDVRRAVVYEALVGVPQPGEHVRLEVSALDRRLGTGGHAMVSARLDAFPVDPPREGHLVKCRYMPDQVMVTGVDEQDTPYHEVLSRPIDSLDLDSMPVVVADLHSSLPAILAGLRAPLTPAAGACRSDDAGPVAPSPRAATAQPGGPAPAPGHTDGASLPRVVYIMTDGGALPLAYSRTVAALTQAGWLAGTVTVGQAWGGDLEATSVHNGLLAARHVLGADITIVVQGPGNLGTDTPWGFSGVACGDAINAVGALGGRPVACLRVSQADPRERHRGISHHSLTAYGRVALVPADVVVPALDQATMPGARQLDAVVRTQAEEVCAPRAAGGQHRLVEVNLDGLREALEKAERATGLRLSTMGRGLDEDEAAFLAAAAAGRHARRLLLEE